MIDCDWNGQKLAKTWYSRLSDKGRGDALAFLGKYYEGWQRDCTMMLDVVRVCSRANGQHAKGPTHMAFRAS